MEVPSGPRHYSAHAAPDCVVSGQDSAHRAGRSSEPKTPAKCLSLVLRTLEENLHISGRSDAPKDGHVRVFLVPSEGHLGDAVHMT